MIFFFFFWICVDEMTSICLEVHPVWDPSWSQSASSLNCLSGHSKTNNWPGFKLLVVPTSNFSFFNFLFSFQQMLVHFLKKGCGYDITSTHPGSAAKNRAADRRAHWIHRAHCQTWPTRRFGSASVPPRRPAFSSTSVLSPPTSWRSSSNPPVRTKTASRWPK